MKLAEGLRKPTRLARRGARALQWRWILYRSGATRQRRRGFPVRVSYAHHGFPCSPGGPNVLVSGGAVKYRYLDRQFPHAGLRFDVLYVVSSSHSAHLDELMQAARRRGAKVVWNQNGVYHPQSYPDAVRLNARMASVYGQADYVFYQSQFCRDSAGQFLGKEACLGEVLYNAVDTKAFVPGTRKSQPPAARPGRELRLLMAGSHYSDYRLPCGIRTLAAVHKVRPARLMIAGRIVGDLERQARALIAELGLAPFVTFVGAYTQSDAPSVFQQGDIYLHTKYLDPCPSAVIEAMACGLPVAYSRSGGTVELVGDEAGIGAPVEVSWHRDIPPDPEALGACVLRLAEELESYSQTARDRAINRFDLAPWLVRHERVFETVAAK